MKGEKDANTSKFLTTPSNSSNNIQALLSATLDALKSTVDSSTSNTSTTKLSQVALQHHSNASHRPTSRQGTTNQLNNIPKEALLDLTERIASILTACSRSSTLSERQRQSTGDMIDVKVRYNDGHETSHRRPANLTVGELKEELLKNKWVENADPRIKYELVLDRENRANPFQPCPNTTLSMVKAHLGPATTPLLWIRPPPHKVWFLQVSIDNQPRSVSVNSYVTVPELANLLLAMSNTPTLSLNAFLLGILEANSKKHYIKLDTNELLEPTDANFSWGFWRKDSLIFSENLTTTTLKQFRSQNQHLSHTLSANWWPFKKESPSEARRKSFSEYSSNATNVWENFKRRRQNSIPTNFSMDSPHKLLYSATFTPRENSSTSFAHTRRASEVVSPISKLVQSRSPSEVAPTQQKVAQRQRTRRQSEGMLKFTKNNQITSDSNYVDEIIEGITVTKPSNSNPHVLLELAESVSRKSSVVKGKGLLSPRRGNTLIPKPTITKMQNEAVANGSRSSEKAMFRSPSSQIGAYGLLDISFAISGSRLGAVQCVVDGAELNQISFGGPESLFDVLGSTEKGNGMKILLCKSKQRDELYVVKVTPKSVTDFSCELELLEKGKHPCMMEFRGAFVSETHLLFVFDYSEAEELYTIVADNSPLGEPKIRLYIFQIASVLKYIHSLGYIHRDIKLENIVVTKDDHIKLTDFGLCLRAEDDSSKSGSIGGTPEYFAPEIILAREISFSLDWWAVGVVLHEMLFWEHPFYDEDKEVMFSNILHRQVDVSNQAVSLEAVSLVHGLLEKIPAKRLGQKGDILRHPFFLSNTK